MEKKGIQKIKNIKMINTEILKEKMIKILENKQYRLLVMIFGFLIIVVSYYSVIVKYDKKIDNVKVVIDDKMERLNELKIINSKRSFYLKETKKMASEVTGIVSDMPSDIQPETLVMYADTLEKNCDVTISDESFTDKVDINDIAGQTSQTTQTDQTNQTTQTSQTDQTTKTDQADIDGYKSTLSITFLSTYDGLKELLNNIENDTDKKSVETLSANFDNSTGKLSTEMTIDCYALSGTGRAYEEPLMPNVPIGKTNIFNTLK